MSNVRPKYLKKKQQQSSSLNCFTDTCHNGSLCHQDTIVNEFDNQKHDDDHYDLLLFDKKIALATEALIPFFERILRERTSKENALIIAEYITAAKRDWILIGIDAAIKLTYFTI